MIVAESRSRQVKAAEMSKNKIKLAETSWNYQTDVKGEKIIKLAGKQEKV